MPNILRRLIPSITALLVLFLLCAVVSAVGLLALVQPEVTQIKAAQLLTALPIASVTKPAAATATPAGVTATAPLRAAFYDASFPQEWDQNGIEPFTNFAPTLGNYDSTDPDVLRKHIAAMQYGHISAGIVAWQGKDTAADQVFGAILAASAGTTFRWAVYYQPQGKSSPSAAQLAADLAYLRSQYGTGPNYLQIGGRFVVFVSTVASNTCEMADRWAQANTVNAYVVLKVFANYKSCGSQPAGWHQYAPTLSDDPQGKYSYTISPGYWRAGDATRLPRDLTRWYDSIRKMVASSAALQLISTFNNWGDGTAIESAQEWQTASGYGAFLDALHVDGQGTPPDLTFATLTPAAAPTLLIAATPAPGTPAAPRSAAPAMTPSAAAQAQTPMPTLPASNGDPVLAAAGDIACDPTSALFAATGARALNNCREGATSDLLLGLKETGQLTAVADLGDNTYENGAYDKYVQSYDPTWGRLKDITRPAVGNHEYLTKGAAGYYQYFGAAAGDPKKGYYSYDLGAWHAIVLNSNCSQVGGCGSGSPQETWLTNDLNQNAGRCTLAYWHHPRFSSGEHGNFDAMQTIWQDLYDYGTAIILTGHSHDYERFAPQDASGNADSTRGIREFVVGTGGKNHTRLFDLQPNSQVFNDNTYGILKLTLHPSGYDWQFVPEPGKTFTDTGSGACNPQKP